MNKNTKNGIIVFSVILCLTLFFSIISGIRRKNKTISYQVTSDNQLILNENRAKTGDYIAAVYIEGTISQLNNDYDQVWLKNTIIKLRDDKKNKAIAVYINSPGGAVYQTDEIYLLLEEYKKVTGRKVYVYQGQLAASGGYYISCAADKIYANRNTLTGSIGVITGATFDITEFLNKNGIKSETFYVGRNKNLGNYNEKVTEEQRQIMIGIASECYDQFTQIVADSRNLPINAVRELSDGRIYTAKQALNNGLIDAIGTWSEMLDDLSVNELNNRNIKVTTFQKPKEKNLMSLLMNKASDFYTSATAAKSGIPLSILEEINSESNLPSYLYK